jgi:four helix bundle protein
MQDYGFKNLKVFQMAYESAMGLFQLSARFPVGERYSLTDQIRRSSRSVCANIAEGYRKRMYPKHFALKMSDADGEASETVVWLDFAKDCGYLKNEDHEKYIAKYHEIGQMLGGMVREPERFLPK